jgi:hypothetical protein
MKQFSRMYIFKETHLPTEGWLHGCFVCHNITGNCEVFNKRENDYQIVERVVFVCRSCCRILADDDELRKKYDEKVSKYIQRSTH